MREDSLTGTGLAGSRDNRTDTKGVRAEWMILASVVLLVTLVFAVNVFLRSNTYVSSPERLVGALVRRVGQAPGWSLWGRGLEQPFPNRVLFRVLYIGIARTFGLDSFGIWLEFVALNYVLSLAQAFLLYFYCTRTLRLSRGTAALSIALVLLSFTHLFAFEYPVYVIEDVLAYVFLLGGLIALSKQQTVLFQLCVVLGVLTRETLLILLVVYFLYSGHSSILKGVAAIPGLLALALPRLLLGNMAYNPLEVSLAINLQRPVEALVFVFAAFGVLWCVIPFAWYENRLLGGTPLNRTIGVVAVALILIASLVGGRLRETRLVYLAFPWIVVPSAAYLVTQYDRLRRSRKLAQALRLIVPTFAVLAVGISLFVSIFRPLQQLVMSAPLPIAAYLLGSAGLSATFVIWQWEAHRHA
jgi:hypothetical protein